MSQIQPCVRRNDLNLREPLRLFSGSLVVKPSCHLFILKASLHHGCSNGPTVQLKLCQTYQNLPHRIHYETLGCFCSNQRGCFGFHFSLGDNGPVFKPEKNGDGRCGVTSPTSAKNPWKFHGKGTPPYATPPRK